MDGLFIFMCFFTLLFFTFIALKLFFNWYEKPQPKYLLNNESIIKIMTDKTE